ncbi:MAG: hypothetical protein JST01_21810 [Cyanobacteria bacterium SZAS TMP-1]|nr:hypothetical protein [Cyanobacteria bacterium SZAS TMP-1]
MSPQNERPLTRVLSVVLTLLLVVLPTSPVLAVETTTKTPKLDFTLTETENPRDADASAKVAAGTPMAPERVKELINRFAPLPERQNHEFRLPEQSLVKPQLPGSITRETFPPTIIRQKPVAKPTQPSPLKVTRVSPQGLVDNVKEIAVTFSQPMVALSEAKTVNPDAILKLTPQPQGQWEWAGTQTLLFHPTNPEKRLPKATNYKLTVFQSARSVSGSQLPKEETFSIDSVPVAISGSYPGAETPQNKQPIVLLLFNQDIDRDKVAAHLHLRGPDQKDHAFHQVSDNAIRENVSYQSFVNESSKKRWIAVMPDRELSLGERYRLILEKGCPSEEGPRLTEGDREAQFVVHDRLKITRCTTSVNPDGGSVLINFNNQIATPPEKLANLIKISPDASEIKCYNSGNYIQISANFRPLSRYSITISGAIRDSFGQPLGHQETRRFEAMSRPSMVALPRHLLTIAPNQTPEVHCLAQAIQDFELRLYRVEPEQWPEFLNQEDFDQKHKGSLLTKKHYGVGQDLTAIRTDLKPFLRDGHGQFAIYAEYFVPDVKQPIKQKCWVQVTEMGLDAFRGRKLSALATTLAEGKPIFGAKVKLLLSSGHVTTNESGQAEFLLKAPMKTNQGQALILKRGSDSVILPDSSWYFRETPPVIRWYCQPDRLLYKPGQTVCIKGWQRGIRYTKQGALEIFDPKLHTVTYLAKAADNTELLKGEAKVDATGGFSFAAKLPQKMNLGAVQIRIQAQEQDLADFPRTQVVRDNIGAETGTKDYSTYVTVWAEEFRRPEFEMQVTAPKGTSFYFGETATMSAKGGYFGGGPLPEAKVKWTVTAHATSFSPPDWPEYNFAQVSAASQYDSAGHTRSFESVTKTIEGLSDGQGQNTVSVKVNTLPAPHPLNLQCEGTITDVNRQQWSQSISLTMHPAKTYIGIQTSREITKDKQIKAQLVVTDIDGKVCTGRPVALRLWRREQNGKYTAVDSKEVVSEAQPVEISFTPPKGEQFGLTATTSDEEGRINEASSDINIVKPVPVMVVNNSMTLRPTVTTDKAEYKPGDTAEITISASSYPCYGLLLLSRETLYSSIPLELKSGPQTVKLPITEADYPNFSAEVSLTGTENKSGYQRIQIPVPPKAKHLTLTVKPEKAVLAPGSQTSIDIELKDHNNKPVPSGHVAIAVVDQALLALKDHVWSDPLNDFYPGTYFSSLAGGSRSSIRIDQLKRSRNAPYIKGGHYRTSAGGINMFQVEPTVLDERHYSSGPESWTQRQNYFLRFPVAKQAYDCDALIGAPLDPRYGQSNEVPGTVEFEEYRPSPKFVERTNFSELALFAPDVVTDANGHARVPMHLPDNITKYRIMAVAVADLDKYGSAVSTVSTKMDLAIKPSLPRFLNFGDKCELSFVVQNQTDKPVQAEVIMRAQNAIVENATAASPQAAGKIVQLAANDRVEVRFPIATKEPGTIDVQCGVTTNGAADAANLSIPVYIPASMETFAAYGQLDKGAALQKIDCPRDVYKQVGGLSITTSSTALQALTDAYVYLDKYPFACSEQLSAKLLAMLALHDVLVAFNCLPAEKDSKYRANVQEIIDTLQSRQNGNGGFGLWAKNDSHEYPYASTQTAEALFLAKQKDFKTNPDILSRAHSYLKAIASYIPNDYSKISKQGIMAKALNVRYTDGDADAREARDLLKESKTPTLEIASWLLPVLSKDKASAKEAGELRRLINNHITETASTASTNSADYGDCNYLLYYSPRRTDALVLRALIEDQPDSELIAKLAKGLLAHKKNGAWDGTQENSCVLLALDKYFAKYEKETPNFEAQEWLGDSLLGAQKFVGRSTESKQTIVPIDYLLQANSNDILINKDGPGRLYYRLGLDYARTDLNLKPLSLGFSVNREYEAIDNKEDVRKDNDGVWHIKAGASVRCKLHFSNIGTRYHVALMSPLPGGCEPVNTGLAGNRAAEGVSGDAGEITPYCWWHWTWYEHQNLRDHQAEAFTSLLNAGEHDYSYAMRATTPGKFVVPPAKAEEMYDSETFGRSASETVVIE